MPEMNDERVSDDVSDEASLNSYEFWNDFVRQNKLPTKRTLVYPSFVLRLGLDSSRDMQSYIVVKSRANGNITTVGKTNTMFARAGQTMHFFHEVSVTLLIGIDNNQSIIFEIMDGDKLGVSNGYLFESHEIHISKLINSRKNLFIVHREDEGDHGPPLCKLLIGVRLENALQSVNLHTKDPNKIGFFHPRPPTKEAVRAATPFFTGLFGTYVMAFVARDVLSERCVDPARISADNTAVFIKICLSDPEEYFEDTDQGEGNLTVIWRSLPQYKDKNKTTYDVVCPEMKINHKELAGTVHSEYSGPANRRIIFQLWAQGLHVKTEHNAPPMLISTSSMEVHDFIALSSKLEGDEAYVCEKIGKAKKKSTVFNFVLFNKELCKATAEGGSTSSVATRAHRKSVFEMLAAKKEATEDVDSFEEEIQEISNQTAASEKNTRLKQAAKKRFTIMSQYRSEDKHKSTLFLSTKKQQENALADFKAWQSARGLQLKRKSIMSFRSVNSAEPASGSAEATERFDSLMKNFNYGTMECNIGRAWVELLVESGDSVYEEKLQLKWQKMNAEWSKVNLIEFQRAVDGQMELTTRTTKNVEVLLNDSKGGLIPSFVIDCNAACLQHLTYMAEKRKAQGRGVNIQCFQGSCVLDASRKVYESISFFVKEDKYKFLRVFGGGGVNPPSVSHPSWGFSRTTAFPLCQELLLAAAAGSQKNLSDKLHKLNKAPDGIPLPLCGFNATLQGNPIREPRDAIAESFMTSIDPRGDLRRALDAISPNGMPVPFASWQGYNYNQEQFYADVQDFTAGFMESCTVYEPSVLNPAALLKSMETPEKRAREKTAVLSTQKWQEKMKEQVKITSDSRASMKDEAWVERAEKERQNYQRQRAQNNKIQFQACSVGTSQKFESSDYAWYADIPKAMQYDAVNTLDVEALEILIDQRGVAQEPTLVDAAERYALDKQTGEYEYFLQEMRDAQDPLKQGLPLRVSGANCERAVVWVLGQCPSPAVLERAGRMLERHMLCRSQSDCLLIIVLAAETRFDQPQGEVETLRVTANPFAPVVKCFEEAVARAHARIQKRWRVMGVRPHARASDNNSPKSASNGSQGSSQASSRKGSVNGIYASDGSFKRADVEVGNREYVESKYVRKDNLKRPHGCVVHHGCHNLMLAHYVTWAEVVGQAFLLEAAAGANDGSMASSTSKSESAASRSANATGDSASANEIPQQNSPLCAKLKEAMDGYFPEWIGNNVVGRVPQELDTIGGIVNKHDDEEHDDVGEATSDLTDFDIADATNSGNIQQLHAAERKKQRDAKAKDSKHKVSTGLHSFRNLLRKAVPKMLSSQSTGTDSQPTLTEAEKRTAMRARMIAKVKLRSDRANGFGELTDMKRRFDAERDVRFTFELNEALSAFVQSMGLLDEEGQDDDGDAEKMSADFGDSAENRNDAKKKVATPFVGDVETDVDGNTSHHASGASHAERHYEALHDFHMMRSGEHVHNSPASLNCSIM